MGNIPVISVIIPVYNAEKYLQACLDSLKEQTYRDFELICVDDGSTDKSLEILENNVQTNFRIRILQQSNINAGAARNKALDNARGEYLLFLDADDFFESNLIERITNTILREKVDVIVFDAYKFDNVTGIVKDANCIKEKYIDEHCRYMPSNLSSHIFNFHTTHVWNKVFKRSFIEKNNIRFMECKRTNDLYFSFVSLIQAKEIYVLREKLVYYRYNNQQSLQGTNDDSPTDFYYAHLKLKEKMLEMNCYKEYRQSFLNHFAGSCIYNLFTLRDEKKFKKLYDFIKASDLFKEYLANNIEIYTVESRMLYEFKDFEASEFGAKYVAQMNGLDFPNLRIPYEVLGKRVVLYAAGKVGQWAYKQITNSGKCEVVLWVDKNWGVYRGQGMDVKAVDEIKNTQYDSILIAIENESVINKIRESLVDLNLESNHIEQIRA